MTRVCSINPWVVGALVTGALALSTLGIWGFYAGFFLTWAWYYALGQGLAEQTEHRAAPAYRTFQRHLLLVALVVVSLPLVWQAMDSTPVLTPSSAPASLPSATAASLPLGAVVVGVLVGAVLLVYALRSVVGVWRYVAERLLEAEQATGRDTTGSRFGVMLMLSFLIPGAWFVQRRVRDVMAQAVGSSSS